MSNLFSNLFSPAKIGNLELKNRVCKAPQSSGCITLPEYAEDIIQSGKGDFVVLGLPCRPIPNGPEKRWRAVPRTSAPASAATKDACSAPSLNPRPSPVR